jgi:hypothetical protein
VRELQLGSTYKIEGCLLLTLGFHGGKDEDNSGSDDKRQMQGCCLCVTAGVLHLRFSARDDHERTLTVL